MSIFCATLIQSPWGNVVPVLYARRNMGKRTQSEEELSSVAKHYESLDDFPKHTRSQFQTYVPGLLTKTRF